MISKDVVVLLDQDLLGRGDLVGLLDTGTVLHPDDTLAALDLVHEDLAVDLGDDGGVGRGAGLEELGHARETARDIARLSDGARDLDDGVTDLDLVAVIVHDVGADRQVVLEGVLVLSRLSMMTLSVLLEYSSAFSSR